MNRPFFSGLVVLLLASVVQAQTGDATKTVDWMSYFGPAQQKRIAERSKHIKYEQSTGMYWDFWLLHRAEEARETVRSKKAPSEKNPDVFYLLVRGNGGAQLSPMVLGSGKNRSTELRLDPLRAFGSRGGDWQSVRLDLDSERQRFEPQKPIFDRVKVLQTLPDKSHLVSVLQTKSSASTTIRLRGLPDTADDAQIRDVYATKDSELFQYTSVLGAASTVDSYTITPLDQRDGAPVRPVTPDELAQAIATGKAKLAEYDVEGEDVNDGRKARLVKWVPRDATPKPVKPIPSQQTNGESSR